MKKGEGLVVKSQALPSTQLMRMQEVAIAHGYCLKSVAETAKIPVAMFDRKDGEIGTGDYYNFLELALETVSIPAFGFKTGHKFTAADYGVLGYAIMSSPTVGHGLDIYFKYQRLVGSGAGFSESFRIEGDSAIISIASDHLKSPALHRFDIEEAVAQWSNSNTIRTEHQPSNLIRVNFSATRPDYAEYIEEQLMCPVYYGESRTEIFFPRARLEQPIVTANEVASEICEQRCQSILGSIADSNSITTRVKRLLISQPEQATDPLEVASKLHMSYRTLRRRLSNEGTTLKQISDELRVKLAMDYLADSQMSVKEIAYFLNFSEAANFHRTFKAFADMTPLGYRTLARKSHAG